MIALGKLAILAVVEFLKILTGDHPYFTLPILPASTHQTPQPVPFDQVLVFCPESGTPLSGFSLNQTEEFQHNVFVRASGFCIISLRQGVKNNVVGNDH